MNVNFLFIKLTSFSVNLAIMLTLFISSPLWADENNYYDEKLSRADKIKSSHPKQFLPLLNELNQSVTELSDSQRHYLEYLNIYLLMYQGNATKAVSLANKLIGSNADVLLKFRTRLALINSFALNKNWTEGLATITSLLTELPSIKDRDNEQYTHALLLITIFYNQLEQYELSLSYAKKVEAASENGRVQCFVKSEIIKASFKLKLLSPDAPLIRDAISLCRINREHLIISLINFFIAEKHLENLQHTKALTLLESTLQDTLNTQYPRVIAGYYSLIAQAHWLNKNLALAKKHALLAIENEVKSGTTEAKVLSYKLLFEVAKQQQKFEVALMHHQHYRIADKEYYNESQAKYLAFQLAAHQAIEKNNQIDLLHEKNALLLAQKELTNANNENNRLIILVLLLTLSVLLFWGLRLLKAHRRIKELAEYDSLTGILNRGHFVQVGKNASRYCQSALQELSVIVFDLDHFKKVNDTYGHACGDWALKAAVTACKDIGRKNDIFARIGGEEFCILLTSCNKKAAFVHAESCREAIAAINTEDSGFDFTMTASFGVTDAKTSGYKLGTLLADADSAAYDSKKAGRNQVTLFNKTEEQDNVVYLDDSREPF
jgi:diguanylate cyclase (GGDEF)-like protein